MQFSYSSEIDASAETTQDSPVDDFDVFLDDMQPQLRAVLAKYRIPFEDGEDVLQQALLALVYQWDEIRDPAAWLVGTLRNKCLVYWRERRRRLHEAVDTPVLEWLAGGNAGHQHRVETIHDLNNLISRLPERYRELIRLRYQKGFEPSEVATKMGYRASSVSKITSRSLKALERQMQLSGFSTRP
ncbi:MAG: sigma-70 family RNA polymerase sigma factor [Acidobacteriota bacterium]